MAGSHILLTISVGTVQSCVVCLILVSREIRFMTCPPHFPIVHTPPAIMQWRSVLQVCWTWCQGIPSPPHTLIGSNVSRHCPPETFCLPSICSDFGGCRENNYRRMQKASGILHYKQKWYINTHLPFINIQPIYSIFTKNWNVHLHTWPAIL